MLKRIGVVVLWILATIGTASITLAAVSSVGDHVTEQAAVPIDSEDLLASPAVQALASTTTTTTEATAATVADTSTTTGPSTTTTTASTGGTTGTTTGTSSTTTTAAQGETVARTLVGGTVIVYHQGNSVTFVSGTAASGFSMEKKKGGPDEVIVEFESESHESHYQATVENGQLVIEIDESHGD